MKNKKGFSSEFSAINNVLIEWNPLNIEGPALKVEYVGYIPNIMRLKKKSLELRKYLENDLLNIIGVTYESESELTAAIDKLIEKIERV